MINTQKKQSESDNTELPTLLKLGLYVVTTIALALLIYYFYFYWNSTISRESFAQFGDYFGGTLNPILGFATIGLLVWSIQIQLKELKATRDELAATKNEAKRSADALAAQVDLAERDFKLKEISRGLNEQVKKYDEYLNNPNLPIEFILNNRLLKNNEKITINAILSGVIEGRVLNSSKLEDLKANIKTEFKSASYIESFSWNQCVKLLVIINTLLLEYNKLSNINDEPSVIATVYKIDQVSRIETLNLILDDSYLYELLEEIK